MSIAGRRASGTATSDAPTIVYDGQCAFCRGWVERVLRLAGAGRVHTVPLQDPDAVGLTGRTPEQLRCAVHVVRPDGSVVAGAVAVAAIVRHLPGGRVLGALGRMPGVMWVAERVYRWMARRWGPVRGGGALTSGGGVVRCENAHG